MVPSLSDSFIRAVTYGPFPPEVVEAMESRDELANVARMGATHLRIYEAPSAALLENCASLGLKLFLTVPWTQHVDFLAEPRHFAEAKERLQAWVREWHSHPAVAGFLVANEVAAPLVRWMGAGRVQRALEALIESGRQVAPTALFSYANYPTTEYLLPRNQDFVSFNVYLEDREKYALYLRRLRHLAGRKPLLLTEFGVDTGSHSEERQAEILDWQVEESCRVGLAGTTVFAWSDQWFRGGKSIDDWHFGLTRRDGSAKPAHDSLAATWPTLDRAVDAIRFEKPLPKMSVIVCTYRGSATLRGCLDSLTALVYPGEVEIVVVNDGGDLAVEEIAQSFGDQIRYFSVEHGGLSAARNRGAAEATGDIFAYTDDDCVAPSDWLTWLALEYETGDWGSVGGPNYPPEATNWIRAAVAAAPGGPSHVMLTDQEAEHIPGCNLSVRREVFEEIGGFNPIFRTAGDDVDFCWRIQDAGHRIGFHPEAWVWHHRRFSIKAFFKQQQGYGRAEAALLSQHPEKHGASGGTRWRGVIYTESGGTGVSLDSPNARIYSGEFGNAPFQRIYGGDLSNGLGPGSLPTAYDEWKTRLLVRALAFFQPLARAWSWWRASGRRPALRHLLRWRKPSEFVKLRPAAAERELWSAEYRGREELLDAVIARCEELGWPVSKGDGWSQWDLEILTRPRDAVYYLTTVTEYHGEGALTKLRVATIDGATDLPKGLEAAVIAAFDEA